MHFCFETITDWEKGRERIHQARYGIVETSGGRLVAVHLRPWPKLLSLRELVPLGARYHCGGVRDRCLLYYNQPRRLPNYLALRYMVSSEGTSYRTFRSALTVLDRIAELKEIDAILCDAANTRLSPRLMARFGWSAHLPSRWHRNYIRRFYGTYPSQPPGTAVEGESEYNSLLQAARGPALIS